MEPPIVRDEGLLLFFLSQLFIYSTKKKEPFYLNYCDFCVFYKSTHCSLMLTTFCLGVNAVCQGSGTCQQLLRVSVQRTFHYFFKLCGTFFVVGF